MRGFLILYDMAIKEPNRGYESRTVLFPFFCLFGQMPKVVNPRF